MMNKWSYYIQYIVQLPRDLIFSSIGIYKSCYHFVRAILSVPFCPCHFVQYHFVRSPQPLNLPLMSPFQAPECSTRTPVSTGILPHSLPEWAFRARPGLWQICLCPKVARIAEHKFGCR